MTIEPPDPDRDADRAPALQDEFWGEQAEWVAADRRPPRPRAGLGATAGRWWAGLLGAGTRAERVHGAARGVRMHDVDDDRAPEPSTPDRLDDDVDWFDDAVDHTDIDDVLDDGWTVEPRLEPNRRAGVDPLLARFGGLAVIATLAVPMVMGFVSNAESDVLPTNTPSAASITVAPIENTSVAPSDAATAPSADGTAAPPAPSTAVTVASGSVPANTEVDEPVVAGLEEALSSGATLTESSPVDTVAPCGNRYELAAGDYWIRIADAADVSLAELLEVNEASVDTVLVPGRSICLPVGASTPAPPSTVAPPTTSASTTSTAGAAAASSPRAATPTTTVAPAPTTTAPARPPAVSAADAVAIIREVWPDELEERAIEIAWRESNHRSNVNNWCCYGLFQIHWTAHRSWLGTVGVTSASDLYDPRLNTVAAYTLYQRAGGFGPWGG